MYRFKPIPLVSIHKRLAEICVTESSYCSNENIKLIVNICRGDMRKAINFLQRCKNNRNLMPTTKKALNELNNINITLINEISGVIPSEKMDNFLDKCISKNIKEVDSIIEDFYNSAYSLTLQLNHIIDKIVSHPKLSSKQKALIIETIVSIDQHLINGCDEYIQYTRLGYNIMNVIQ